MSKHPMQNIEINTSNDCVCFTGNAIVRYFFDHGRISLNHLATMGFSQADWTQFAQLIGYSVNGFHELSYVSDKDALAASEAARKLIPNFKACPDTGCKIHCGVEDESE